MSKRANGQGSVRKIGGAWYIRLTKPSIEHAKPGERPKLATRTQIRTEARTRSEALDLLNKKLVEKNEGRFNPDATHTRVVDLYADLKNEYKLSGQRVDGIAWRWKHLEPVFGADLVTSISTARLRAYAVARQGEKASGATINRELAVLRRMLRLGAEAEPPRVFQVPTFPSLEEASPRMAFFERKEFENVRSHLPAHLRPLVTIAYWTGWRKGELLGLEWRQVDLERGTVSLDPGTTKNKDGRLVFLPEEALEALRAWRDETEKLQRESGLIVRHVFHRAGEPIRDPYDAWRAACRLAGVPGRRLHDFRRTAARNYRRAGVAEGVAMKILGHRTRSIFERYDIKSEDDLREAAARVTSASVGQALGKNRAEAPSKSQA
jgi:integrase